MTAHRPGTLASPEITLMRAVRVALLLYRGGCGGFWMVSGG